MNARQHRQAQKNALAEKQWEADKARRAAQKAAEKK